MNVQMALLSILGIVAAVFSFERDVVADTQSTEKIQNNSVTPLMPSEVLLSLEPIARENVLSIVQLATRYTNLSERAFDELHGTTTTNNKDVTTTRIVNSDGTETEIAYSRQDKFLTGLRQTRLDKSSIIAAFVRPSLPVDENYLVTLPEPCARRTSADGRWLFTTIVEHVGTEITFMYNRREASLCWTKATRPHGSDTRIGCRQLQRAAQTLQVGYVKPPTGRDLVWVKWHETTGAPEYVTLSYDNNPQGRVIFCDDSGKKIADCNIAFRGDPLLMLQAALPSLNVPQLDALSVPAAARAGSSPALIGLDPDVRHTLDHIANWSDQFLHANSSDLRYLYPWGEANVQQAYLDHFTEYRIVTDNPDCAWTFRFSQKADQLVRAQRKDVAVYFDDVDGTRFVGGREVSEKGQWLLNLYPGRIWPRIVVAATGELPPHCLAKGKVYVWSPAGEKLLEQDTKEPTPISTIIQYIDSALTLEQKTSIAWRGAKEADYLLGTY